MVDPEPCPDEGDLLAHACAYLSMGLSVIPVLPRSKLPVVKDTPGPPGQILQEWCCEQQGWVTT